ncbi:MAG TPA: hypothetical protein VGR58_01400 [Candidatus Acidoferrum sp.]|nr:hypothetical protein [Candidatus Acidoferrum sp.]
MVFVSGWTRELLRDRKGELSGILLDNGLEIQFPAALGRRAKEVINEGCRVEVEGSLEREEFSLGYVLQATVVKNLDSKQSATLPAPKQEGKPRMQLSTPIATASLAPAASGTRGEQANLSPGEASVCGIAKQAPKEEDAKTLAPGSFFHRLLQDQDTDGHGPAHARNDAARSIGLAYDNLHRIQAILAYLHIMKHRVPGIAQFLDEAKHTYEQSLTRFAEADFTGAKEFAEASGSLSRVVEIVMARTLRSDDSLPSLVPPPPEHPTTSPEPEHVKNDLAKAETVLSRIHWLLENGTLPSEDRAQVRKLAAWGDAFYKQAQRTYRDAVLEDAAEFAQAALAGAYSAEHVCRKWYVSHP